MRTNTPKEELSVSFIEHVKNAKSDAVSTTAFYAPSVSYQTENETNADGKVEKVLEPVTLGMGLLFAGYAVSFIGSIIGWIKDIVVMFKY